MIRDLDFIESSPERKCIMGGAYTQVTGTAMTEYGSSIATINSLSIGQQTHSYVRTSTNVRKTFFSTISYAHSSGFAIASSGLHRSQSSARYSSVSSFFFV